MLGRLKSWMSRPDARRWIGIASLLLAATSLDVGLAADDHVHRQILQDHALPGFERGHFDLFRFASPEHNHTLMEQGAFPWWTDPSARLSFFRPLTSLTHVVDYALWPNTPWLMHLQSVAWFALLVAAAFALYRRLLGPAWIVTLAFFMYALDDVHGGPLTWIANRNALVATSLSLWALVWHHRATRESTPWSAAGLWIACVLFGLSLLAAEGAIAICGYLFAHALFLEEGSRKSRFLRLVPYAVIAIGWRVASRMLGYGVHGSGVYVDPGSDPLAFIPLLLERAPILLYSQLGGPWSDGWSAYFVIPGLAPLIMGLAFFMITVSTLLIIPLWKRDPRMRFFAVGMVLSTLPPSATFPADRLLTWMSFGGMGVCALIIGAYIDERATIEAPIYRRGIATFATWVFVIGHVVTGPLAFPMRARAIASIREVIGRADSSVPKSKAITDKVVVFANPPTDPLACYVPIIRASLHEPRPKTIRWLATAATAVTLERIDARTLRVKPQGGFLPTSAEWMLRSVRNPMRVGEIVALEHMSVRITALTDDARPAEAIITFDAPLEDPKFYWMQWIEAGYVPFAPPPIGKTVELPPVDFFKVMFGAG